MQTHISFPRWLLACPVPAGDTSNKSLHGRSACVQTTNISVQQTLPTTEEHVFALALMLFGFMDSSSALSEYNGLLLQYEVC